MINKINKLLEKINGEVETYCINKSIYGDEYFSINIEISEEEANIFCDNDLDKKIVNLTYFEIERENNKTISYLNFN